MLEKHLTWYPLMELRDIYKLLYQGAMGPEHLIFSPGEFSQRLALEFGQLLPGPSERLTEPVRPDLTMMRLNLRKYKQRSTDLELLIPFLLETARLKMGGIDELQVAWHVFTKLCQGGNFSNFNLADVHQFTSWLEGQGFPAVHHSDKYHYNYQPAYRLIAYKYIHQLGLDHAG